MLSQLFQQPDPVIYAISPGNL